MRMMMKFTAPAERANEAIKDGSLAKALETLTARIKPEATYYGFSNGLRSGMMFFNMTDASQVAEFGEILLHATNATVEIVPVMTPDDLGKALATLSWTK